MQRAPGAEGRPRSPLPGRPPEAARESGHDSRTPGGDAHPFARTELLDQPPAVHGSASRQELDAYGLDPASVLDFSVNTNPLGPAPAVLEALRETDWSRYPGDDEYPLRQALADRDGVGVAQVALGNGSSELLWLLALAVLRPGDTVTILGPTFGEYARCAAAFGARIRTLPAHHLRARDDARLLFVCNPNNPTGAYLERDEVETLVGDDGHRLVVVDEAYAAFVDDRWPSEALLAHGNVVLLRSMTKDHALPGLRLGYLLAEPTLVQAIEAARPPWTVNAGALRAGLAALTPAGQAHVQRGRALVRESRAQLTAGLTALGFPVHPSAANFLLVEVGDGTAFRRALLPRGFVVRDCASFGLPHCVRVACRRPEESARLLDAIATLGFRPPGW